MVITHIVPLVGLGMFAVTAVRLFSLLAKTTSKKSARKSNQKHGAVKRAHRQPVDDCVVDDPIQRGIFPSTYQ